MGMSPTYKYVLLWVEVLEDLNSPEVFQAWMWLREALSRHYLSSARLIGYQDLYNPQNKICLNNTVLLTKE